MLTSCSFFDFALAHTAPETAYWRQAFHIEDMLKLCRPALSVAVSILGNSGAGKKGSSRAKPAAGQTSNRNAVRFTARLKHLQHVSEAQWTLLTTKRMPMMHSKVWSGVSDKTPDTRKGITRMNLQECHLRLERHGHRKEEAAAVMPGRQIIHARTEEWTTQGSLQQ